MTKGKRKDGSQIGILKPETFNCQITAECKNNQCFYRQRDHLGLPVWWAADPDGSIAHKIVKKFGKTIFPDIRVTHTTNCMAISCLDAILDV